jgi:hypothetical protein
VSQAPDPAVLMLRHRAIESLYQDLKAQGRPTTMRIGEGPDAEEVDLGSYEGRRIAMELAAQSPVLMERYRRTTREEFGFDPELEAMAFERVVGGGRLGPRESRLLRRRAEQGGGFERAFTAPGPATAATEAGTAGQRTDRWLDAIESLPTRLDAAWQTLMERIATEGIAGVNAPKLLETQLKAIQVGEDLDRAIREKFTDLGQAINTHFPNLGTQMGQLSEAMLKTGQQMQDAMQQAGQQGWGGLATPLAALPDLLGALLQHLQSVPNLAGGITTPWGQFNFLPGGWSPPNPLSTTKPTPTK